MQEMKAGRGRKEPDLFADSRASSPLLTRMNCAYLSPPRVRELPDPPKQWWRFVGPGLVAAGVGLSSGEFVLWPYIASQVGLVFLWGAMLGVITQWFLNMEIERYTLATAESVLTGFNRLWKHWGLVFAVMVYFANLWPGWATSAATLLTFIVGGNPSVVAVIILLLVGLCLTLAPVVYVALERLVFVKIACVGLLVVVGATVAVRRETWAALPRAVTLDAALPVELGFALLLGAIAFAGAGGGQNLCQSNWIRDKGFGMGVYVPRLVSPLTGASEAAPGGTAYVFPPDATNLARWQRWWRFANAEQLLTFVLVTVITIVFTSMLAHSTLHDRPELPAGIGFLKLEGDRLQASVGAWFGTLFWATGAFALFCTSVGIADYTSRLAADILKSTYLARAAISESRLYACLVWGLVAVGCVIVLVGFDQPLILLVISASVGGTMMFLYSMLLLVLNRRALPVAIRIRSYRIAALIWSVVLFGVLAALTIAQQVERLFS